MAAVIVVGSIAAAGVLVLAWLLWPDLRARMEQPKTRFQDDARRYDHVVRGRGE